MTNCNDVAHAVIHISREFTRRGDVSFHALVIESGYPDERQLVHVEDIERALCSQPLLLASWLQYSEDKRSSVGWYFKQSESGAWIVGGVGVRDENKCSLEYDDKMTACAVFIKNELDGIIARTH